MSSPSRPPPQVYAPALEPRLGEPLGLMEPALLLRAEAERLLQRQVAAQGEALQELMASGFRGFSRLGAAGTGQDAIAYRKTVSQARARVACSEGFASAAPQRHGSVSPVCAAPAQGLHVGLVVARAVAAHAGPDGARPGGPPHASLDRAGEACGRLHRHRVRGVQRGTNRCAPLSRSATRARRWRSRCSGACARPSSPSSWPRGAPRSSCWGTPSREDARRDLLALPVPFAPAATSASTTARSSERCWARWRSRASRRWCGPAATRSRRRRPSSLACPSPW